MNLLVLGANSDIGLAVAQEFAIQFKAHIQLASRDIDHLKPRASDLEIRHGASCEVLAFDALDHASHQEFYDKLEKKPDVVILTFGILGDQAKDQKNKSQAMTVLDTNFNGAVSILEIIANDFEARKEGMIIGVSSVAGDRGRASNYLYGAAKAGFTAYISGLRNRLFSSGVHVMTVLPGFVQTKMTAHLNLSGALVADPESVAKRIVKGYRSKKNIIYVKPIWKWIMLIIKHLPEPVFKRLSL